MVDITVFFNFGTRTLFFYNSLDSIVDNRIQLCPLYSTKLQFPTKNIAQCISILGENYLVSFQNGRIKIVFVFQNKISSGWVEGMLPVGDVTFDFLGITSCDPNLPRFGLLYKHFTYNFQKGDNCSEMCSDHIVY